MGTNVRWGELGTGVPPATKGTGTDVQLATGTGTRLPSEHWAERAQVPNGLKLSDRHRRRKGWKNRKDSPALPVRWSAWLGPRLQSGRTWTDVDSGGGRTGAAAGKG